MHPNKPPLVGWKLRHTWVRTEKQGRTAVAVSPEDNVAQFTVLRMQVKASDKE